MKNTYIADMKNNKQIRIKYNKLIHDWCSDDSGWMEELWCYDDTMNVFKCYYPVSTYENDFHTIHNEKDAESFMREAFRDFINDAEDTDVSDIIIEDCNISVQTTNLKERIIKKLNIMTDEEIKHLFNLLSDVK